MIGNDSSLPGTTQVTMTSNSHAHRDPLPETDDFTATNVSLGPIGKPQATETNKPVSSSLPFLYAMLKQGKIVPNDYIEYEKSGVEALPEASAFQLDGKGGNKKVIVKIQDE